MKTLNDYIQQKQTECFNKYGAFFAFGQEQFNKQKKEGVIYAQNEIGLIYPKENSAKLHKELGEIHKLGRELDIKENGVETIIERELANYECFYTWDISDAVNHLSAYNITEQQVKEVFNKVKDQYE
jgi:hypothetical protein